MGLRVMHLLALIIAVLLGISLSPRYFSSTISPIFASITISVFAGFFTWSFIDAAGKPFLRAGLLGKDMLKKNTPIL